ncbi:sulfatase-like hydrolase/transferase [Verrucomicrobia bacterium]|nr:sulfatase-like hydrolase/transferase [Verrucomicrobiota bacterium]
MMKPLFLFQITMTILMSGFKCNLAAASNRPNILWLSCEDISPTIACYGDPHAITPHLDRLASEGVLYTHAFTTAGVCAPCRSGIITGMYQSSIGTHHMRSNAKLPPQIMPFPVYLQRNGYYCTNNGKQDYQFDAPSDTWSASGKKAHWRNRRNAEQPFFSVFNYNGCHESGIANDDKYQSVTKDLQPEQRQEPENLTTLPPYYPDNAVTREDWKRNYEVITAMDAWAGKILEELYDDGLEKNTIVFFWSDHGVGLPRAKRWLYDSGTHIPLIIRMPEAYRKHYQIKPGTTSEQLISSVDFCPTVMNLAGIPIPGHIQGQPFLGKQIPAPRQFVFGARDRMDERYDIIRMVRDKRFKYIRNYEPLKTFYQYMNTPEKGATMKELRRLHNTGNLLPFANAYFSPRKPNEELYDCNADPHELNNLADNPAFKRELIRLRRAQLTWVRETKDLGLIPEAVIARLEETIGNRYAILRQEGGDTLASHIAQTAVLASSGVEAIEGLTTAIQASHPAIRYWALTGLGNIGVKAVSKLALVEKHLSDASPAVALAAARALCRMEKPQKALPVLLYWLMNGEQWEQLQAAIVLDEINAQAAPVLDQMRSALDSKIAKNKYVVRVVNRALNEELGTANIVP